MLRALRGGAGIAFIRLAIVPMKRKQLDVNRIDEPLDRNTEYGVDRVLAIFDRDEYGTISPEASFINLFGFTGGLVGAIYGGLMHARLMNLRFRESNEATVFDSKLAAERKLLDSMTLSFSRGAARYGIRYGIFCFSFAGLSTIIYKFRGEPGVLEFSMAGLITGALYKFSLGPKGMFAGGFFGLLLGTFGGLFIYAMTKLADFKLEEIYEISRVYFIYKDRSFQNSSRVQADQEDILLEVFYSEGMGSMTHTLDGLEDIKSPSELRFNKNPALKISSESTQTVNNPVKK